jgi:hypothetical protein
MMAVEFVIRVVDALEKLHIPYMTVGAFATNVYAEPRSTKDADFVLQLGDTPISKLASEIGSEFILDAQMSFETITSTTRYRVRHRDTNFLIEFFMLSDDPHDQARFSRRIEGKIGTRRAFVPTAEDVIITKLRWSQHGQRPKDLDDAQNVIDVQFGQLDLDYIRKWCDLHDTRGVFEKLLEDSKKLQL